MNGVVSRLMWGEDNSRGWGCLRLSNDEINYSNIVGPKKVKRIKFTARHNEDGPVSIKRLLSGHCGI